MLVGILLVSLNLRPAIASVPPLLETIRADAALSYAAVSLLTAIPVLCMGVFAFATPTVSRRLGRERGVFWALGLIAVATAARVWSARPIVLFGTTVLVGVGIAIAQTLLPSLVGRYFPDRVAFATGLYTASLTVGATLATGLTVPVESLLESWPLSLASWTALAVVGLVAWIPVRRSPPAGADGRPSAAAKPSAERPPIPWRDGFAWTITLVVAGSSTIFYSGLTWLAPRYVALGWSEAAAGWLLTAFVLTQLGGMLAVSAFADRTADRRPWFLGMLALVIVGTVGIAAAPLSFPWAWSAAFGAGIGGLFSLALTLPVDFTPGNDDEATDRVSTMAMGTGYAVAAVGPFAIGALRDLTGGYDAAFAALVAVSVLLIGLSLRFSPRRPPIGGGS